MKIKTLHSTMDFEHGGSRKSAIDLFISALLIFCFLLMVVTTYAQPPSHDPTSMVRAEDGRYWIYTTGTGVWAMSSSNSNFSDWQPDQTPFNPGTWPSWINSAVPGFVGDFWAPGITYMNGYWYLYYSCSTFGSSQSAIGVVRTPSLSNPNWSDQGMVVSSNGSSNAINAIDPAIFHDTDGRVWMSYGSFFGGIAIVEINPSTGKTIGSTTHVAGGNHQDIEAPYIIRNGDYYYLFVNRGSCCNGLNSTYYVQVGRSTNVTGPYAGWRTILGNEGNYIGPGHIGYGEDRLTYHYYDGNDNGAAKLRITSLGWSNGWPVIHGSGGWEDPNEPDLFALNTSVNGQGSVTPNGGTYEEGTVVNITANPANGWQFNSWSGDISSSNATTAVTMNSNMSVTANFSQVQTTEEELVFYTFNQSSGNGILDESGNENNGTGNGNPSFVAGKIGNSINLDGSDDYVSLPTGVMSTLNNFTIATWVNIDALEMWSRIFDFGSGTTTNMFLTPQSGNGTFRYAITTGGGSSEQQINGTSALPTNTWIHVAVTLSGNTGTLYVNGSQVGINNNMTLSPSDLGSTSNNYIGRSQYADPYLDGQIDQFHIFDYALTSTEISSLFNTENAPTTFTLSIAVEGQGSVSPVGGSYASGTTVNLTATPASGWQFDGWSDDATGSSTSTSLLMNSNKTVTASFSEIQDPSSSFVQIQNRGTGLFLDGMGRVANGEACGQWANTSHVNSHWEVLDVGSGYYQLQNVGTGLLLDGMGRTNNGGDCGQWANTTHFNSHWTMEQFDGNYVRFQNRGTGLFLDGMGRTGNGDNVGLWANTTHPNAQWLLVQMSGARAIGTEEYALETEAEVVPIYPNPAQDHFVLDLPEIIGADELKIINIMGQKVMEVKKLESQQRIDISQLAPGQYILQLKTAEGLRMQKFVKI